jgi:adhesin transport system outer membrane protein
MAPRPCSHRNSPWHIVVLLLTTSLSAFAAPATVAISPSPAGPPQPSTQARDLSTARLESRLAATAAQDEQVRLAKESDQRGQAQLAHTAAENERLRLTGQGASPAIGTPLTPPPAPRLPTKTAGGLARPAADTLTSRHTGLLEEMFAQETPQERVDNCPDEATLKQWLAEALRRAAEHTPQMHQLYAQYLAAEADVDQAKGQRLPQLSLKAQTRERRFGSQRGVPPNPGNKVQLSMTTTLFDWGQTAKTIDSRKQLATANEARYRVQLENLAYQVASTVLELSRQRNIAGLYQRYAERMSRLVDMLTDIVQADRGRTSELTQAKARLLQARISRDAAIAKMRDAELALHKLIGKAYSPLPDTATWPIGPADLPRLLTSLEQHPAILQAAAQARAADLTIDATRASSKPKLSWVVSGGTGRDDAGYRQPWATMLTVTWPLFSGGTQRAATVAAQYRAEAQWHDMEQQRLDVEYQLRSADEDARNAFRRAGDYGSLSQEADQIRRGFFVQWRQLGQRTLLDVLSAESDYYSNRIGEVSSRFDAYQAVMRTYVSAGELVSWLRDNRSH